MKIGHTGTQFGMTDAQKAALRGLVKDLMPVEWHHGDCIGADAQGHDIVREILSLKVRIVVHPPTNRNKRAFKECDVMRREKPYLIRNKDIVDETDALIATPKEFTNELRSGTWSTYRYAKRLNKRVILILPNGSITK